MADRTTCRRCGKPAGLAHVCRGRSSGGVRKCRRCGEPSGRLHVCLWQRTGTSRVFAPKVKVRTPSKPTLRVACAHCGQLRGRSHRCPVTDPKARAERARTLRERQRRADQRERSAARAKAQREQQRRKAAERREYQKQREKEKTRLRREREREAARRKKTAASLRRNAATGAVHARRPGSDHPYQNCRDTTCNRITCRAWREGYDAAYDADVDVQDIR